VSKIESFKIKTEVFEGPLDLLLNLIEKRKLLINEISLAKITDDYIKYIRDHNEMTIGQNSHFILVASTLLLIKSKSILPTIELSPEEEESIEELERRLKIHKRMKDVEPKISELFFGNPSFPKRHVVKKDVVFAPSKQISVAGVRESVRSIIKSLPKVEKVAQAMLKKVVSLEEMIVKLTDRVKQGINMSFKEFSNFGKAEKVNVVVGFLAMLELVKEGIIDVNQDNQYGDINIQTKEFDTPNYS
jgi:segregation and condensation protein A